MLASDQGSICHIRRRTRSADDEARSGKESHARKSSEASKGVVNNGLAESSSSSSSGSAGDGNEERQLEKLKAYEVTLQRNLAILPWVEKKRLYRIVIAATAK